MTQNLKTGFLLFVSYIFLLTGNAQTARQEFRAVWVATVTNIDWPATATLSAELQRSSFIRLLDFHKKTGLNAVIVQIRPAADAFYPSPFEPWSQWLTGKQGTPPNPYYDPLEFMIEETHKRGMEFHAWMNPYRAVFNLNNANLSATHVSRLHPEWFLTYGDKKYFDPGNREVMQYVTDIVTDVVQRYDVDAIHFDDYFYPYKLPGKEFPDAASFRESGSTLIKDDWRRSNTDSIIKMLHTAIKNVDPNCRFGISPFGVWRNKDRDADGSMTTAGVTNYDDLYADILLWLRKGWIDYVTPQLYWEFGHKAAPFEELVQWWGRHTYGKDCYIGIGLYRAGSNAAWRDKTQLPRQIKAIRSIPSLTGIVLYSSSVLEKNPNGWADSLRLNYFR